MATDTSQSDPSWVRWAPAALLAGVAILSLFLQWFVFVDPTDAEDWARAAADVIERVEGDEAALVRVHPTWNDSALVPLGPVGQQIDTKRTLIPEDLVGVTRFVVMSELGRRTEAIEAFPFNAKVTEARDFGSVETFVVEVPDVKASFNMRSNLGDARVTRVRNEKPRVCDRWNERERRWDCEKRERWLYVGDELREVGDEPRRCIYAHPLGGSTTLALSWKGVELGESFRLRSGIDLRAARAVRGDEVVIRLFFDEDEVARRAVPHRSETWFLDEVVTTPGRTADVRVEIDTGDRFERFFCFDGWVWNATID